MYYAIHLLAQLNWLVIANTIITVFLLMWLMINLKSIAQAIQFHKINIHHKGQKFIKRSVEHSQDWIESFEKFQVTLLFCAAVICIQFITVLYLSFYKS